ncbi:hypothetical protein JW979_11155 [bacterium]|nr:hypothetical protein [candidate division CSSED10-310 bacterium]
MSEQMSSGSAGIENAKYHVDLLLIAALRQELGCLLTGSVLPSPPVGLYRIAGTPENYFAAICGVGKKKVRQHLRQLLRHISPRRVIIAGWAGLLQDTASCGDIVLVNRCCHWKDTEDRSLVPDKTLTASIEATLTAEGVSFQSGAMVTADRMVDQSLMRKHLAEKYLSLCVDMETFYLASILSEQRIPFAVVRVVSDTADERIGLDIERLPRSTIKRWCYLLIRPRKARAFIALVTQLKAATRNLENALNRILV